MKKKANQIDSLIENLVTNFSQIKNLESLQESDEGKRLFDLIVKSMAEMETFQALFLNYYIPASNKSIADGWNEINKSKYKHLLNIKKEDLNENLYETIRLGYVGLFHKYEAYLKALVEASNFLLQDLFNEYNLLKIEDYCKKEFNLNIFKSHDRFSITNRLNYISNCIKHYDGYPRKEPIHQEFKHLNWNERLKIEPVVFKTDILILKKHCQLLLSQVIYIGFKQYIDKQFAVSQKDKIMDGNTELNDKYLEVKGKLDVLLADFY